MKLAKAILVALVFSGASAMASSNPTSNSTCTHNKKNTSWTDTKSQYAEVVFGGATPQPAAPFQPSTSSTSR